VKEWVDNLKSTVYDVDDLFDEIVIKAKNKESDYASFLNVFSITFLILGFDDNFIE
jgi:hypothetical protein